MSYRRFVTFNPPSNPLQTLAIKIREALADPLQSFSYIYGESTMNNPRHYHRRALLGYAVAAAAAIAAPIIIGGAAGAYKAAQSTPGGVKEKGKAAAVGFATGAMGAGSNIAESFK